MQAEFKKVKKAFQKFIADPREARTKQGANQSAFWGKYGVTQSGGSRYETERDMPVQGRMLIALHLAGKITDEDLADALALATAE